MENELLERLISFIYDQGWGYSSFPFFSKKRNITRETRLLSDLKITGDDADEFLLEFAKEFNVNINNFVIGDYFGHEEDYVTAAIKNLFRNGDKSRKPLTVGNLEKSIIIGRLDEDVINS